MRSGEFGLACGSVVIVDASGTSVRVELTEGFDFDKHAVDNSLATGSVALRREVLADVGVFHTALAVAEDYDLWLRITERYRVVHSAVPLYCYREWSDSLSRCMSDCFDSCLVEVALRRRQRIKDGVAWR